MGIKADSSFWEFALKFHEKEPIIANIVILLVVSTPIVAMILRYLNQRKRSQVEDNKNIKHYAVLMEKVKRSTQHKK